MNQINRRRSRPSLGCATLVHPVRHRFVLFGMVLSALVLFNGCSSGEDEKTPEPVQPTFSSLWDNLLTDCGDCHNPNFPGDTKDGPNLADKTKFLNELTNKTSANYPAWVRAGTCTAVAMIAPGDANNSTVAGSLIESVSTTLSTANECTTSYNLHLVLKSTITDQAVADALVQWINAGAANN